MSRYCIPITNSILTQISSSSEYRRFFEHDDLFEIVRFSELNNDYPMLAQRMRRIYTSLHPNANLHDYWWILGNSSLPSQHLLIQFGKQIYKDYNIPTCKLPSGHFLPMHIDVHALI